MKISRTSLVPLFLALVACSQGRNQGSISASGYIEATEVRVGTKVPGRLAGLKIKEGDTVTKGRVLAQIDPVDLNLALQTAKAELGQFEADLRGAEKDFKRMQELLNAGSGTAKARDDAKTRHDMTAGRVAASKARIAQMDQQILDMTILSPLGGVVTQKLVEEGELLAAGATLAVVTDLDDTWLTAYVTEPDLSKIRLGQEAEITTDSGASRKGKITFIASSAEFTPKNVQTKDERVKLVYKVKISVPNADNLFKPGMPSQAAITPASAAK
jgi:HlyD family secretion protein